MGFALEKERKTKRTAAEHAEQGRDREIEILTILRTYFSISPVIVARPVCMDDKSNRIKLQPKQIKPGTNELPDGSCSLCLAEGTHRRRKHVEQARQPAAVAMAGQGPSSEEEEEGATGVPQPP